MSKHNLSFIFPLVYTALCFTVNMYVGFLGNHSKRKKLISHFLKLEATFLKAECLWTRMLKRLPFLLNNPMSELQ